MDPKTLGQGGESDDGIPMSANDRESDEETVVELEFELDEDEFFLAAASGRTECQIELETMTPRSDGTVLEFLTVRGGDIATVEERLASTAGIVEVEVVHETEDEALVECISETRIAESLADEETVFKQITATGGHGRLVAEVPPHIDASTVIDSFLAEHPSSELVARRQTDRRAPTLTKAQFLTKLVEDLTEKQMRALRIAHANGYFEWPREHTADEVAEMLDVSTPTFSEHLRIAERKLLDEMFE